MKSILKDLFFDKDLVNQIKERNLSPEVLYVQLMSGKITMKEYIAAR